MKHCFSKSHTPAFLLTLVLLLQIPFIMGCVPFVFLSTTTVTNLSSKPPYKAFVGKFVIAKEACSLRIYSSSFNFRDNFILAGTGDDSPINKIADLPVGTRVKIHSIKHKKVSTEMGGYDGTKALCTVFLSDGRKIACQMDWSILDPDPGVSPTLKFELVGK